MTWLEFIETLTVPQSGLFVALTILNLIVIFALLFFIGTAILRRI